MDIAKILQSLPKDTASRLQLLLEDCAVSAHLLPEEAREILDAVVARLIEDIRPAEDVQRLLAQVPDAVVSKIYG